MNTQKTQTRGFTLVELIVLITILVILGTIAFINLGGQSAGARDSKRTSDVRNLVSQVNIKQTGGVGFVDMISSGSVNQLTGTNLKLAGSSGATATEYTAGKPSYTVLGVSPDAFKDPNKSSEYVMGATTLVGGAYQVAATLENDGGTKSALVMGIYNPRGAANTASGTANGTTVTLTSGKGLFKVGDKIFGTATGTVTAVSSDLGTLTTDFTIGSSAAIRVALPESNGLIKAVGAEATATDAVVNNSGAVLIPYTL